METTESATPVDRIVMPCRCQRDVTQDGWHFYRCKNPAKFVWTLEDGTQMQLCGIHARGRKGCVKIPIEA